MVDETTIFRKNQDFVARKIAGELILIPLQRRLESINCIYNMNEMACQIWDKIDGQKSYDDLRREILADFEVEASILDPDLTLLINQLQEIKAIQPI